MGPGTTERPEGEARGAGAAAPVKIRPAASDDLQRIAELLTEYARMGWLRRRSLGEIYRDLGGFIVAVGPDEQVVGRHHRLGDLVDDDLGETLANDLLHGDVRPSRGSEPRMR